MKPSSQVLTIVDFKVEKTDLGAVCCIQIWYSLSTSQLLTQKYKKTKPRELKKTKTRTNKKNVPNCDFVTQLRLSLTATKDYVNYWKWNWKRHYKSMHVRKFCSFTTIITQKKL